MKLLICVLLCLPGLAQAGGTISASDARFRYLLPQIPAGGYVTLKNDRDHKIILTGASSPACGMLMLHESKDESGMAMMMAVKSVTIEAHQSFSFAPDGYHLMCDKPQMKIGQMVPVTLAFADGTSMVIGFNVGGAATQ